VKWKGDIVEAVIGELAETESNGTGNSSEAAMFLNELLAFIAYCGEKDYFEKANAAQLTETASPPPSKCT
jgi:hypothetical protein